MTTVPQKSSCMTLSLGRTKYSWFAQNTNAFLTMDFFQNFPAILGIFWRNLLCFFKHFCKHKILSQNLLFPSPSPPTVFRGTEEHLLLLLLAGWFTTAIHKSRKLSCCGADKTGKKGKDLFFQSELESDTDSRAAALALSMPLTWGRWPVQPSSPLFSLPSEIHPTRISLATTVPASHSVQPPIQVTITIAEPPAGFCTFWPVEVHAAVPITTGDRVQVRQPNSHVLVCVSSPNRRPSDTENDPLKNWTAA